MNCTDQTDKKIIELTPKYIVILNSKYSGLRKEVPVSNIEWIP